MAWSIDSILQDPMLERVGWALLHSVWQGAAIAVVLAASLHWTRRPQTRYLLACFALILSLLAPAATVCIIAESDRQPSEVRHFTTAADASPVNFDLLSDGRIPQTLTNDFPKHVAAPPVPPLQAQSLGRSALPYASILWALGVIILCIRHIGGLFAVRSLRRDSIPISDPSTIAKMTRLLDRLAIRQSVALCECARTSIPCVIGFCRPMILLPVGMIANLSPQFLESILAHELAHIRRHDYLVNLLQIAIETLLFYHPAAWWISNQIREEREHCCDDVAVEMVGDATVYGEALTALEEIRIDPSHVLALGITGGSLLHRIARLLNASPERSRSGWPIPSLLIGILLIGFAAPLVYRVSQASAQRPESTTQPSTFPTTRQVNESIRISRQVTAFPSLDGFLPEDPRWLSFDTTSTGALESYVLGRNPRRGTITNRGLVDLDPLDAQSRSFKDPDFRLDNPRPPIRSDSSSKQHPVHFQDSDIVILNGVTSKIDTALPVSGNVGTLQIHRINLPSTLATRPATQPIPATSPSDGGGVRLDRVVPFGLDQNRPRSEINVVWGGAPTGASLPLPAKSFRINESGSLIFLSPLPVGSTGNLHYGVLGSEIQWLQSLKFLIQRNSGKDTAWEREISQQIMLLEVRRNEVGSYMRENMPVPAALTAAVEDLIFNVEKRFAAIAASTTQPLRQ